MKFYFQQAVRALILLAFSVLLFQLHFTGEITKFINPKYEGLSQIASIIFLILFFIQITRIWNLKEHNHRHCNHDDHVCSHDHGYSTFNSKKLLSYSIIVFPLITGFILPAKVLDASIVNNKGGMEIISRKSTVASNNEDSTNEAYTIDENKLINDSSVDPNLLGNQKELSMEKYDLLVQELKQNQNIIMNDTVFDLYYEEISKDIDKFVGKNIQLKGFVYKEDGFSQDQLVISRFLITHCVADASIIGFLSEFKGANALEKDTWIEANGVLDITTYNGTKLPVIKINNWKKIHEPKEPYIYPIMIKVY